MREDSGKFINTISPWLSVHDGATAIQFYKSAFQAIEVYHIEDSDGAIVSRLSVGDAEYWISDDPNATVGSAIRMILIVEDPDFLFKQAVDAGASIIFPVNDAHGWRLGRLADPFGFHWEIGRPHEE